MVGGTRSVTMPPIDIDGEVKKSRQEQIADLVHSTRLKPKETPREQPRVLVTTPREHMPGYTGYVPGTQFAHGVTYGKSTELGLQLARTPREKQELQHNYQWTTGGNLMREIKQDVPSVRGPTFTGFMTTPRLVQGSDTDLSAYYKELEKQQKETKEAAEMIGKAPIPAKNRIRNKSHIQWGDSLAFQGSHMFLTTNEDTYFDKDKRAAESYPEQGDGGLSHAVNIQRYQLAALAVGPVRMRMLEEVLRDKLMQKTGSGPGELRRKFKEFDRDQSGSIDMSEFAKVMEWFGCKLAQRECLALFGKFDKDGSGELTYYEFVENLLAENKS